MPTTFEVLYLGTGPILDTTEGNLTAENDSALLGMTFGSAGAPLAFNAQRVLSAVDITQGDDADRYNIDNSGGDDSFSIDGGPAQVFDGLAVYNATLSYTDGTPDASITAVVFQDDAGNLYLAPEASNNADQAALTAAPIESITLNSIVPISSGNMLADRQAGDFLCFATGTRILTPEGERPVEQLRPGDLVTTLDRGPQPIRWIRIADQVFEGAGTPSPPVLLQRDALAPKRPRRDLVVSGQHRILVGGRRQLGALSVYEVLVPAKALTLLPRVRHALGKKQVRWVHFACDRHEIVRANGCWCESLLLGPSAMATLPVADCLRLFQIFKTSKDATTALNGPPARPTFPAGHVRREIARQGLLISRA